MQLSD